MQVLTSPASLTLTAPFTIHFKLFTTHYTSFGAWHAVYGWFVIHLNPMTQDQYGLLPLKIIVSHSN